jgi:hypothetical protein
VPGSRAEAAFSASLARDSVTETISVDSLRVVADFSTTALTRST